MVTGMEKRVHSLSGGCGIYNIIPILSNACTHPHLGYVREKTERLKIKHLPGRTETARWPEQDKETEHKS